MIYVDHEDLSVVSRKSLLEIILLLNQNKWFWLPVNNSVLQQRHYCSWQLVFMLKKFLMVHRIHHCDICYLFPDKQGSKINQGCFNYDLSMIDLGFLSYRFTISTRSECHQLVKNLFFGVEVFREGAWLMVKIEIQFT